MNLMFSNHRVSMPNKGSYLFSASTRIEEQKQGNEHIDNLLGFDINNYQFDIVSFIEDDA